jgi:hypothetical protein
MMRTRKIKRKEAIKMSDLLRRIKRSWDAYLQRLAKANKDSFGPGGPDCCTPKAMKGSHSAKQ